MYERKIAWAKQIRSDYAFLRTHLKRNDPHFTFDTANRLIEMILKIVQLRQAPPAQRATAIRSELLARARSNSDSQQRTTFNDKMKELKEAEQVIEEMNRFWKEWRPDVDRLAPSLANWQRSRVPQCAFSKASVAQLAAFFTERLLHEKAVSRSQEAVVTSTLERILGIDGESMTSAFVDEWANQLYKKYDAVGNKLGSSPSVLRQLYHEAWKS